MLGTLSNKKKSQWKWKWRENHHKLFYLKIMKVGTMKAESLKLKRSLKLKKNMNQFIHLKKNQASLNYLKEKNYPDL